MIMKTLFIGNNGFFFVCQYIQVCNSFFFSLPSDALITAIHSDIDIAKKKLEKEDNQAYQSHEFFNPASRNEVTCVNTSIPTSNGVGHHNNYNTTTSLSNGLNGQTDSTSQNQTFSPTEGVDTQSNVSQQNSINKPVINQDSIHSIKCDKYNERATNICNDGGIAEMNGHSI